MKILLRYLAAGLLIGLLPALSRADFLLGVTYVDSQLISVNSTTGTATDIGTLGTGLPPNPPPGSPGGPPPTYASGLAASNGRLFTFDGSADLIRQVNPFDATYLSSYNVGITGTLGQGGLAFQGSTVGFLSATTFDANFNPINELFRFDLGSLSSTPLTISTALGALAFSGTGTLYGLGKADGILYTVNTTTGQETQVGDTGVPVMGPTESLTFAQDGTLYATLNDKLYSLNPATGAANPIGSADPTVDTGASSITGLVSAQAAVPEPASVAMTLTGLGVAAVSVSSRRQRRARASS